MIELTKILTDHLASQTSRVSADHFLNPKRFDQDILANLIHYDLLGWSIIPGIQGTKKPIVLWKNKARMPLRRLLSESARYGMMPGHHPNFAIKLGQSKLCVLDIDNHDGGADGQQSFAQLVNQYGALPTTPADSRNHFYFKLPAPTDLDFKLTVAEIAPGVELFSGRTDKSEDIDHILWAPPSTHHSGVEYQWLHGLAPWETELAELPRWVCDLAAQHWEKTSETVGDHHRSTSPGVSLPSGLRELPSTDQVLLRARAYMRTVEPAVSGQHGHDKTMYAACRLILEFDLSVSDALPLMEEWNDRCSPPWDTSDLIRKLHEADKQPGPRGRLRDAALPARRGFSDADAPDMSDISIGSRSNKSSNPLDVEEAVRETAKVRRKARPARTPELLSITDSPAPELSEILDDIEDLRCKWHRFTIYPQLLELFQVRLETIAGSEATLPLHEAERRRLHEDILSAKRLRELEQSGKYAPTIGMPCRNKIVKSFHNERKHLFRIIEFDCGTWTCPTCRVKLAAKWKSHLESCMMSIEPGVHLYHGEIDPTTEYRTRARKTRRGLEDKLEEFSPAWAATYKQMVRSARRASRTLNYRRVRVPGRLLLISTEPFTTLNGTPAAPVDAAAAVWINRHEIDAIETDRPISVSDGWKLPQENKSPQGWKSVGTFKNSINNAHYDLAPILAAAVEKGLSLNDSGPYGLFVAARWDSAFRGDQSEAEALHRGILRLINPDFSIDPATPRHPSDRENEPIPVF